MKTNVFIVVPNWNGADELRPCLQSLTEQTQKAEIVVVDNGSIDESIKLIEKFFAKIKVIKLEKNYGFAGGVNKGIEYAMSQGASHIALFNNDAVADKNWLKELSMKANKKTGIVTGKLLKSDKRNIDSTGDFYSIYGLPFPRGRNEKDSGQYDNEEEVFAGSGGASLYSVEMFKDISLFDEDFFAYFEDVDIGFRAQHAGWKVQYNPKATAYHKIGATSGRIPGFARYHSIKNFLMLYLKNMPASLYWKYLPKHLWQLCRMFGGSIRDKQMSAYLKALFRFLVLLPSVLLKRWGIQHKSKLSARDIDTLLYKKKPPKVSKK